MLVLSRKLGEKVFIGRNITVTVVGINGNKVRLAFEAPDHVGILREELISHEEDADLTAKPGEWETEERKGPGEDELEKDGRCSS